jgi:hypothetical protein
MERETIDFNQEQMHELWNGVYWEDKEFEFEGDAYTQVDNINTSDSSDGESHDYIIKRKSDGKHFKFNAWDAGYSNGWIFSDGDKFPLVEVIPQETVTIEWT